MAETQRSLSALLTLLADNTSGDISPEDLRDVVETVRPRFGGLYLTSASATVIGSSGTMVKAAGTTTSTVLNDFTMPTDNRLQYNGVADVHAHIAASCSFTSSVSNTVAALGILKNGTLLPSSRIERKLGTGSDVGAVALHTDAMLTNGDYLELAVELVTATGNVTVSLGYLFAMTMPV